MCKYGAQINWTPIPTLGGENNYFRFVSENGKEMQREKHRERETKKKK